MIRDDAEERVWLEAEIDHALACAERARAWAHDVRACPDAHPGCNAEDLEATAVAFDLVAHSLSEARR